MARISAAGRASALIAALALAGCDTLSDWIGWDDVDDAPPRASSLPDTPPPQSRVDAARPAAAPAATVETPPPAATPPREPYAYGAVVRPTATPGVVSAPRAAQASLSPPAFGPAEAFVAEAGDRVFFAENDARIGPRGRAVLERQALWLRANPSLLATVVGPAGEEVWRESRAGLACARAARASRRECR